MSSDETEAMSHNTSDNSDGLAVLLQVLLRSREKTLGGLPEPSKKSNTDDQYLKWLAEYLEGRYQTILDLQAANLDSEGKRTSIPRAIPVFTALARRISKGQYFSIQNLAECIKEVPPQALQLDKNSPALVQFAFSLFGTLTFLYNPENGPEKNGLFIEASVGMNRRALRYQTWKLDSQPLDSSGSSVSDLLCRFGGGKSPIQRVQQGPSNENQSQDRLTSTYLCYDTLYHEPIKARIVWTESLCEHLDFSPNTKILKLFMYPSICALLASHSSGATYLCQFLQEIMTEGWQQEDQQRTVVSGDFFVEVLCTFRLLFGQNTRSRNEIRKILAPRPLWRRMLGIPGKKPDTLGKTTIDPLLYALCCQEWSQLPIYDEIDAPNVKAVYSVRVDFPYLGHKLCSIQQFVEAQEPDGFWSLWSDKRDLYRYYNFTVLFWVGVFGALTAVVTVTLAGVQVYYAQHPPCNE